jgi:cation diffusion facilitator CzcD-associated flavoprotein CzcO
LPSRALDSVFLIPELEPSNDYSTDNMDAQKKIFIIGGGVSGMGMAIQLQRLLGHQNFTIFEKADNLGGTWWHNRYPACACDIPSHLYSYSFAMKSDWSTMYPERDELHDCKPKVQTRTDGTSRC